MQWDEKLIVNQHLSRHPLCFLECHMSAIHNRDSSSGRVGCDPEAPKRQATGRQRFGAFGGCACVQGVERLC